VFIFLEIDSNISSKPEHENGAVLTFCLFVFQTKLGLVKLSFDTKLFNICVAFKIVLFHQLKKYTQHKYQTVVRVASDIFIHLHNLESTSVLFIYYVEA